MVNHVNIDESAVFVQMSPLAGMLRSRSSSGYILEKTGHIL
ncbi:MAG: hypothetical protein WCD48_16945 [Candidatus Sulfotelmatobacter sp.]